MRLEFCVKTCEPGLVKYEPRVKLEPTGRVMRSRLERLMVSLRVAVKRRLTGLLTVMVVVAVMEKVLRGLGSRELIVV